MARHFPYQFKSLQEYEGYQHCTKRLRIGDTVYGYCSAFGPSTVRAEHILSLTVIATGRSKVLLGMISGPASKNSHNECGLWSLAQNLDARNGYTALHPQFDTFTHAWSVSDTSDMLIARVDKKPRY
jgi:hypothetical protein